MTKISLGIASPIGEIFCQCGEPLALWSDVPGDSVRGMRCVNGHNLHVIKVTVSSTAPPIDTGNREDH